MKLWTKGLLLTSAAAAIGAAGIGYVQLNALAEVGAGYRAKILCSEVFVAGRTAEEVDASEFAGINPALDYVGVSADLDARVVTASLMGLGARRAVYREGLGCTLADGGQPASLAPPAPAASAHEWPLAAATPDDTGTAVRDYAAVRAAVDAAFADGDGASPGIRAALVIQDGRIVAERYADGFGPDTRFLSWSMAKSVNAALLGVLVGDGLIDPAAPAALPEWSKAGDPRAAITVEHLLHMSSGLAFSEDYDATDSDVVRMLYAEGDMAGFAARKPLAATPGEVFYYSSGTSNILSRLVRDRLVAAGRSYEAFPRTALFDRIGMTSAVFEPDHTGVFAASSYVYATARDWARMGSLYLNDGVFEGVRVLPEGWVGYSRTPAPASDRDYGAQIWLNGSEKDPFFTGLPDDVFLFSGHDGQYVVMIPDKNAIIVRLGLTRTGALDATRPMVEAIYRGL
jgi:hypothetical protein